MFNKVTGSHSNIIRGGEAHNWLYVESDQSHSTSIKWGKDPAQQVKSPLDIRHLLWLSIGRSDLSKNNPV